MMGQWETDSTGKVSISQKGNNSLGFEGGNKHWETRLDLIEREDGGSGSSLYLLGMNTLMMKEKRSLFWRTREEAEDLG